MKRLIATFLLALPLAVALSGCGDDPTGPRVPEDVEFAAELGVDLDDMRKLETGVYVQTLQVGPGSRTVEASDSVVVDYTLWLPDGTELDSGDGARFELSGLIPGVQDGVLGMVEGEIRLIVVPSDRGFGGNPPNDSGVPPHSVLVFRVALLDIPTTT